MRYSAVMHETGEVIAIHDDESQCGRLAALTKRWPDKSLACPWYVTETRNIQRGRNKIFVCVRRAGFDFPAEELSGFINPVKGGEEFYDLDSVSAVSADHSIHRMEMMDRMVSGPEFDASKEHPFIRVARVRLIEIPAE